MRIALVPVESIGERPSRAMMCGPRGCGIGEILMKEFPADCVEAGKVYRAFRVGDIRADWLSIREAARATGLDVLEISAIERGEKCFANDAGRELYLAALAEAHLRKRGEVRS